ncbi:MAG: homoserine O-succinyltransferase [Clostridia bacterium]|nr:homoserine O-succinyltransferase [Clostridia bacterium]
MPIKIPNNLPAIETLRQENIFCMTETRADTQDIRPLKIILLNLMPTKIDTETQFTRLLGNTPLQVELTLVAMSSHESKNTTKEHMIAFYKSFDDVKGEKFDGMIVTGAPVEMMDFEQVDYWQELTEIFDWAKTNVHSTMFICWGAQAGLYHYYGVPKRILPKKFSGIYPHKVVDKNSMLFRGFDDVFNVPQSRNSGIDKEEILKVPDLKILSESDETGVYCVKTLDNRKVFITGHSEYDALTLEKEYLRDKRAGLNPDVPVNYYPNDDDTQAPMVTWRAHANLLFMNWLNYYVYQSTPYDVNSIKQD